MPTNPASDASLDRFISLRERYGPGNCADCEVGEPHVCRLRFASDIAQQRRALQIAYDLMSLQ